MDTNSNGDNSSLPPTPGRASHGYWLGIDFAFSPAVNEWYGTDTSYFVPIPELNPSGEFVFYSMAWHLTGNV